MFAYLSKGVHRNKPNRAIGNAVPINNRKFGNIIGHF